MTLDEWDNQHGSDEFLEERDKPCRCCLHGRADAILAVVAVRTPNTRCPFCSHALMAHDYIRRYATKLHKQKEEQCKGVNNAS